MPYRSARQRAYMHIHHPKIAAKWDREYGTAVLAPTKKKRKKVKGPPRGKRS